MYMNFVKVGRDTLRFRTYVPADRGMVDDWNTYMDSKTNARYIFRGRDVQWIRTYKVR